MRVLATLVRRWKSEGVPLFARETEGSIHESFLLAGSRATSDVIELYASLGGMEQMDNEYWRLWPLKEVRAENVEPSSSGILFSDYLINCWCYRLRPNIDDTSFVLVDYFNGKPPEVVANTLDQFLEAYAVNPTLLLDARSLVQGRSRDA